MDIGNQMLGEGTSGAQGQKAADNELDQHDSDETSNVEATVGDDIRLTIFPVQHFKKTKTKLGRGAFGTVRV